MKRISYIPSKDKMVVKFCLVNVERKPTKRFGRFELWMDKKGNINAFAIEPLEEELEEFRKNLNKIQLGGIWKGVEITAKDIKETRQALLKKLKEKW